MFRKFRLRLSLPLPLSLFQPHPRASAVLVDETLPSMLGALFACNGRVATGTGIAEFDFLISFNQVSGVNKRCLSAIGRSRRRNKSNFSDSAQHNWILNF